MRGTFGWDLPPGCTIWHIDEACGGGDVHIISIGNAGKGGYWFAIDYQQIFGDGFATEAAAEAAAIAAAGAAPYEIWYECAANGRTVTIPGPKSANHPENEEL